MLGQALVKEFSADNEVVAWDREEIDITDKNQVLEKISALHPSIIINAAAYNNVDKAEKEDRDLAMKVNGEAVGYLVEIAGNVGATFVHYSTDYVFKGDKVEGYKENDEPNPQSWYAKTKREGEGKILKCHPEFISGSQEMLKQVQHDILRFYLIRTSRLFGPAGVGEGAKESFVETMLKLGKEQCHSRESGNPDVGLNLIDEETSSPTYVKDLARATRELIESDAPWGIYHRTNEGACTWYGWAEEIFELAGLNVKLNSVPASHFPRPAVRPKYSKLLTTKLPPLRRWEEALEEYLKTPL